MSETVKKKRGRPPKQKPIEQVEVLPIEIETDNEIQETKLTPKKQQLKDYYAEIVEISQSKLNISYNTNNESKCVVCHKDKPHSDFFRSYSWGHIGNLLPSGERHVTICKRCAKKIFNFYYVQENNLKQAINHWCQTLDVYYSEEIFEAMINLHNSRKGTEMEHKFDYITDYMTALGRAKMIDMTYWDSPYLQNSVKKDFEVDKNYFIDPIPQKEYPEEFDSWDKEDLENYDYVLTIYKYDPFKDEPIEDRRKLYYNLAGFSDEGIMDDFARANAAIDTCRSMQRLEKLNRIRVNLENNDTPDIKEIKAVSDLQKIEREAINRNGKEHGFIQKYSLNKNQGSGTFTGITKQMSDELFENELANAYDIKTSNAMQMAAEASWKAIFGQLNISESEFSEIVKNQRETIMNLRTQLDTTIEQLRLANIKLKKIELENKLREEQAVGEVK